MPLRMLVAITLLMGAWVMPVPATSQEAPSPGDITCALDPKCPKPQPPRPPHHKRRGVITQGGPAEQPLSVNLYVNFEYKSANLTSDARITLDRLGIALSDPRLAGFSFMIAGHTDAVGGAAFNRRLSERRAQAVRS